MTTFDRRIIEDASDLASWTLPDGEVPVRNGETVLGTAKLRVEDGSIMATIVLDGETVDWPSNVRIGLNAQTVRFHDDGDGVRVVDEARVLALIVG